MVTIKKVHTIIELIKGKEKYEHEYKTGEKKGLSST